MYHTNVRNSIKSEIYIIIHKSVKGIDAGINHP